MSIKIKLSLAFQHQAGSDDKVEVKGKTLKECIDDLSKQFPSIKNWLFDNKGSLLPLVLLNNQSITPEELDRPVFDNDEIWILDILEGG
jgi:molybdopterin converting factor small subunit